MAPIKFSKYRVDAHRSCGMRNGLLFISDSKNLRSSRRDYVDLIGQRPNRTRTDVYAATDLALRDDREERHNLLQQEKSFKTIRGTTS